MGPPIQTLFPLLDIAGLSVFAASGALVAARKRLDFVGACFFALITATGGGTLRDILIGAPRRRCGTPNCIALPARFIVT